MVYMKSLDNSIIQIIGEYLITSNSYTITNFNLILFTINFLPTFRKEYNLI